MTSIFRIAVSGLNDAVARITNAASNMVNASSIGKLPSNSNGATSYAPKDVITLSVQGNGDALGVISQSVPRNPAYGVASDPSSSNANAQGLVAVPNVDLNSELVTAKGAEVSYGANAKLIKIAEKMQKSLIDALK